MIGSETLQTDTCPTTHPYAFGGGTQCCKTQKEANKASGARCDGSTLDLGSDCCENEAYIRCPSGDGKLCSDGNANGKLLIISIQFDTGLKIIK